MPEVALNMSDQPAVVGEPASQPHQAAVMGEPPEEMVPVLGEPVPFGNGLQNDQQPVSFPSPHEPAINGGHKEPPTQTPDADAHDSTPANIDVNSDADISRDAEVTHIVDVPSEPTPPEREISTQNPFSVLDEGSGDTDVKESVEDEEPAVVGVDDSVVTHISDVPSKHSPLEREIPTDNPFSILEEGSGDTDLKESVEGKEPEVVDEDVTAVKEVEPLKGSDDSGMATTSPSGQKGMTTGLGSTAEPSEHAASSLVHEEPTSELKEENNAVHREIKVSESTEADTADPQLADTSTEESPVVESSPEQQTREEVLDENNNLASTGEDKEQEYEKFKAEHLDSKQDSLPEGIPKGEVDVKERDVNDTSSEASRSKVEQAMSRETNVPEAFSSGKVSGKEGGNDETAPDSSLLHRDKDAAAETFPMESSNFHAANIEAGTGGQPPSDVAALGENGFQRGHNGTSLEREQFLTKDEKPSSFFKVPVLCTLAIAVVGVAVAAISRSRR
ncbi:hypothetical protein L7F22_063581 [Adiantum nelumboides]|nr:hypothetical protein [Adiantum nelumboides]MCO5609355.1 hypothetical protein [Adiantum nelumboides]